MITNIRSLLHEQNYRLTQEREVLLDLFSHANKALTPIQLHQSVLDAGVRIGLTTVYRMLEVLTKIGLASPYLLDGAVYYTCCPHSHHHHFICLQCHRVDDLYDCQQDLSTPDGCAVEYHKLDLFGTCATCTREAR
ncbi:Fur family transcriptional regulator [Ferroacidibacillus organovorans]|uniref:Fur family transcriptional regulator n=1 Tax=Ferroacidibacillus organovorans TaxID=1765683 RepID=UPI0009E88710